MLNRGISLHVCKWRAVLQITASKVESATCVCFLNSTKDKESWLVCLFADDVFMPDCPSKKGSVSGNPRRRVCFRRGAVIV